MRHSSMPKPIEVEDISTNHASPTAAVEHAISRLSAALAKSRYGFRGESRPYLELRRDLPYIIHKTALPGTQILVNRNYKPVGHNARTSGAHVEYEQYRNLLIRLSPAQIASVVSPPHEHGLFGDGNPPWRSRANAEAYLVRLEKLHKILATSAGAT